LSGIISSRIRLASTEIREDPTQVAREGAFLVVSPVLVVFGFSLPAGVHGLAAMVGLWAASLEVGVGVATVFLLIGRKK